ncbi:signal transduction histidine kinase [Mycobacterium sp. JS623]|uniref:sensor histidine kinase n=1 Tax=Mycobacterium sp. JS623 TaxID=212767 RepID=UPI0002A5A3AD|nr:ATP-binding protein [Mycobacterium sp. JS623]AGB21586.1 signal transduction histidine kinase [Mycobacterium sp. JS623]
MTAFSQLKKADGTVVDFEPKPQRPAKRPSRWSITNWPVRWKVFAIVLVPLVLAGTFGGLRIYSSATDAADLRRAADRAEMVPAIQSYMGALDAAMLASSTGGDTQAALTKFDSARQDLQRRLTATDVAPDVNKGVTTMIGAGQALMDKVTANSVGLRDRVQAYTPILLTAEDAINGSVRVDDERIRAQALGLSRAVGARGQMMIQQLLVNLGGELADPELRMSMTTVAGTEPSTLFGMSQVLGIGSPEAQKLQQEFVKRMAIMSDPAAVLVNNPDLSASIQATKQIADKMVADTSKAVTDAVESQAAAQRTAAIRDTAIVVCTMLVALLLVILVARSLVRPLRRLRDSALKVAHDDLARELDRVRAGAEPGHVQPIPVYTSEEVGQVAHAVDELHEQAVLLASEQSRLQLQVSDMFETLSRRSRSLVDQQLSLIDRLERNEEDPERLESLFRLDHLAARMRRNGANLLVLAGAKVPREQVEPVPVSAIINAAASEVEDYTRVVTATVPDSEIVGAIAGDLVHLLAELLDNALRYSPPISQVRVSAVHTGNGGLVIEVSDIGIGMTESDLRVANTRLQSGGEVNPYTARHMGLFVVGRLASQHGLVVRLRSTIAGEPNSGTTAGVFVPGHRLVVGGAAPDQFGEPEYGIPADAHAGIHTALALDEDHDFVEEPGHEYTNGHVPVALLPQRNPGASGISDIPASLTQPAEEEPADEWPAEELWPEDSMPAHTDEVPPWGQRLAPQPDVDRAPVDTSAFFASRAQAASNGVPTAPEAQESQPQPPAQSQPPAAAEQPQPEPTRHPVEEPSATAGADDAIYQRMLSEWLVDPTDLAKSDDLNWESVWDHGWSVAAAADDAPVAEHTEEGLPVREPGARLVPGAVEAASPSNGTRHANGGAHRSDRGDDEVASAAEFGTGGGPIPPRDPDAVRASISNHFGGVRAGRSHAQETRGTDNE